MKTMLSLLKSGYRKILNIKYYLSYFYSPLKKLGDNGILLISHELQTGGAETLLYYIAKNFKEQGINVCILSLNNGVMFHKFYDLVPLRIMSTRKMLRFTKRLIEKNNYNKVICNTVLTGHLVRDLKLQGYQVISLVHEMELAIKELNCEKSCSVIAKYSDSVIFPSTYVYSSFLRCIPFLKMNYKIKNQGLFLTKGLDTVDKKIAKVYINKKYGICQNRKIILNVAMGSRRKGFDLFLSLANQLKNDSNILFVWIGGHTNRILANKLREYNIDNFKNVFLTGYISSPDELNKFYAASDILFLSSREDPFPSIVLEAFYAKTPVVAFKDCGGFIDIIKDDITGALAPAFDLCAVQKIILELINNPNKLKTMGQNCRTIAEKNLFSDYCNFLLKQFNKD